MGVCDEGAATCKGVAATAGSACDDNDPCTEQDKCAGVQCKGTPKDCSDQEDKCHAAFCNSSGSCVAVPLTGEPCNDSEPCTLSDKCTAAGTCSGTWDQSKCGCDNDAFCAYFDDTCNVGKCDLSTHECYPKPLSNGTSCNADGDGCTVDDSCQNGTCKPGSAAACEDDGKDCTDDVCVMLGPSSHTCLYTANGDGCYIGGSCWDSGKDNPSNSCQQCLPGLSAKKWTDKPTGTSCNADSNGCTVGDACDMGTCYAGSKAKCDDGLSCTEDTCVSKDPSSYDCEYDVAAGQCAIDNECYPNGAESPNEECMVCDAATNQALWSQKPNNTTCGEAVGECSYAPACDGGFCVANGHKPSGTGCGSDTTTECDGADTCDGNGSCQSNQVANGTDCGSKWSGPCSLPDTCYKGVCESNDLKDGLDCGYGECGTCLGGLCEGEWSFVSCAPSPAKCECCSSFYCADQCPGSMTECFEFPVEQ